MKKIITIIITFLFFSSYSQNCDCEKEFEYLVNKIENDYAGFQDKVNKYNIAEYEEFTKEVRLKSKDVKTFLRCNMLLNKWLEYFNDKHLSSGYESNIYYTFKSIDDSSSLLRIPGFSWNSKTTIDTLVQNNLDVITSKPILIIDLRGNGGGTDYAFQELLPLIYTEPYISKGVEYLASEGNIEIFEKALEDGEIKKGKELETHIFVDSLKANKGGFYQQNINDTVIMDSVYSSPKLVGVIVDDFCASSCEQFVLSAKQSSKTLVFGTRTLGVLDYSNAVREDLLTKGSFLQYPMSRSMRLPDNPIDNLGIKPDIEINKPVNLDLKSNIDEWVIFANDYLKKQLKKTAKN